MSAEHTQHAGKDSIEAMKENDAHTTGHDDAVPGGTHAHSPAAHETGPEAHTKPVGDERGIIAKEETSRRVDRGSANNRGLGAGLRGNSGGRGE